MDEEVQQLAHKSIDELRGLLKATAYVIASAPTLRAKHEVSAACVILPCCRMPGQRTASMPAVASSVESDSSSSARTAAPARIRAWNGLPAICCPLKLTDSSNAQSASECPDDTAEYVNA